MGIVGSTVTDGAPVDIRRRLTGVLFTGVSIGRTGYIAAVTVTTLVAEDMLGSRNTRRTAERWRFSDRRLEDSASAFMDRVGRRRGLVRICGDGLRSGGAAWPTHSVRFRCSSLPWRCSGSGASADSMSRYAAAGCASGASSRRRDRLRYRAGTIGSVLGPTLLSPAEGVGRASDRTPRRGLHRRRMPGSRRLCGDAVFLRPDPLDFADRRESKVRVGGARPVSAIARTALIGLSVGQAVMVLIMVMTPSTSGNTVIQLGTVGGIIAKHTLGMFAVSPLTGMVADRIGGFP